MKFNCLKCGFCCHYCNKIDELKNYDRGDGVCMCLDKNNNCEIYDSRPDICNVKKMHAKEFSYLTLRDYYKISEYYCTKIIELHNKIVDK